MGGWGRRFIVVDPAGRVLPCHAATTIPGLAFANVRDERARPTSGSTRRPSTRFRGTAWMPEPCRSCDRRELDWGGCRCQALALTGDAAATDPACALSPHHARGGGAWRRATPRRGGAPIIYRGRSRGTQPPGRHGEEGRGRMFRVLIADDHPLFRAALRQVVETMFGEYEILEASTLDEASRCIDRRTATTST